MVTSLSKYLLMTLVAGISHTGVTIYGPLPNNVIL